MNNNSLIYNDVIFTTGDRVTCEIMDDDGNVHMIKNAKIYVESNNRAYICHNFSQLRGADCLNHLGYKYSWVFCIKRNYDNNECLTEGVYDLELVSNNIFKNILSNAFPKEQ